MTYQPDLCADVPIVGLVGDGSSCRTRRFDDLLDEPMAGTVATDPAAPALIAFTSGTTSDPKGVVHSHQTLGFETRQLLANYPPDRGRQLTATPVGHFIGMLGAFLIPVLEGAPIDLADVWDPAHGAGADEVATASRSAAGRRTSSPACSTIPTAPTSTCSTSRPSASAARRCPPRSPGGWPTWASSCSAPTAAPSTRRSRARRRRRRRTSGSTPTATPGRASRSGSDRRRRDLQPRTGSVPRLHRSRADRQGLRRRRLVPHRRRRCARRRRLPDHHRPQGRRDHPRRREHQRARGRGGAARRCPRSSRRWWWPRPTTGSASARPRCCGSGPGTTMPTLDEVRDALRGARAWPRQKWPEELHEADDFPRTASGKVQKFRRSRRGTLRSALPRDENRILSRGKGVFHGSTFASGRHPVPAVRRGQPPVRAARRR